ncbi:MAG: cyclophilin-like fold protein [Nocardioidaceae bacterium]|nr:cyclophilin-like fold protein [Nocardioidaceae bacterium]
MPSRPFAVLALGALLAACSPSPGGETASRSDPTGARTSAAAGTSQAPTGSTSTIGTEDGDLEVVVGDTVLTARLRDTAAARDLRALLPVTVTMTDHGGVEKTGALPSALSTADEPAAADPDVGDLGYYAPGQDLVVYYGDQSAFDGIVVLGRLRGDLGAVADAGGDVTVTVREPGS